MSDHEDSWDDDESPESSESSDSFDADGEEIDDIIVMHHFGFFDNFFG